MLAQMKLVYILEDCNQSYISCPDPAMKDVIMNVSGFLPHFSTFGSFFVIRTQKNMFMLRMSVSRSLVLLLICV